MHASHDGNLHGRANKIFADFDSSHLMEEQDKLLETASAVVREQAFFMKKAIEQENLRDALKYSSNMISELRTSQLSPRFYYELYMLIFQELQHLTAFFSDKSRHGRKLAELYESVQHAGSILPRLYLLVTVGVAYIQSQETAGVEILRDMAELCKGIQHPIRGLFLRYYLLQMTKDKLQAVAAESPSGLEDVVDFILNNFNETTRLWIRLSSATTAGQRDRAKRERERHDLRILVGASLVRLSQLDGLTRAVYTDKVLPRIMEQVIACKDALAQQYLLDCTVQVFPDDFHLESLSVLLSACSQTQKQVDLRPVLINLMNRLRTFLVSAKIERPPDVFGLFRLHLERIMHRTDAVFSEEDGGKDEVTVPVVTAQSVDSPLVAASKACGNMLELYQAYLGFTLSLNAKKFDQVSIVHGMALAALDTYMQSISNIPSSAEDREDEDEEPVWLGPLTEIVETTAKSVPMSVALALSQFGSLLAAVPKRFTKQVSMAMIDAVLEEETDSHLISDPVTLSRFLTVVESLLHDQDGTGPSDIDREQVKVCTVVHLVHSDDLEQHFELLTTLRSYFGRGGPKRLKYTLPTLVEFAKRLAARVHACGEPSPVTVKKVFQNIHNLCLALVPVAPELAFRELLSAARQADEMDANLEPIAHEFFTQALICFEEELTDSKTQVAAISGLVGALVACSHLAPDNYEALATRTTQHAARLLKKIDQCRGVLACSHLFYSSTVKDPKRVLECLQRGLKIADVCVQAQTGAAHELFVECLNAYIHFYETGIEEIAPSHISNLIALCREHAQFAAENPAIGGPKTTSEDPLSHLNQTVAYMREKAKEEGSKLALIRDATDRKENIAPKVVTSDSHE